MRVHRSCRLEELVDALLAVVAEPLASPFTPDTIVVPARCMGDWLALRLAERQGIWANPRFVTAERYVGELAATGAEGAGDGYDAEGLAWTIAAVLPELRADRAFTAVAAYLADDHDTTKRLALARRLGRTFRRYLVHRPELLRAWERGEQDAHDETAAWQAALWRAIVHRHGEGHPARRVEALVARLGGGAILELPERVSVFAPEAMPRAVLDVLEALSAHVPVHVFLRVPGGHVLADSVATRGLELEGMLASRSGVTIHDLGGVAAEPALDVHACHAPMRECEVLRDQLLAALNDDPSLEPRDILVLCPELEAYAPLIDAVFGSPAREATHLPYRIVDRSSNRTLRVVEGLLALLEVAPSRLTSTDVLDLLAREPVRAKFSLEESEIDVVRRWIAETGIRWAEDEAHRAEVGQPRLRENTWRFGLDRLVLGYAMGSEGRAMCGDCLPYDDVEGTSSATLGGLATFCEELFAVRRSLAGHACVSAWRARLLDALSRLFHASRETEFQHQLVRQALDAIVARAAQAGFVDEVPLAVVKEALAAELDERGRRFEQTAGGIAFASLVSSRCVPARIVALLGMNDGAFPRPPRADAVDLVVARPMPGDPSTRDEGRQAFFDALSCARERLVVTYVGQSIADNAERPPSVLVSELLDTLPEPARKRAVVRHPLHAFSPRYFGEGGDARLFSHEASLCDGASSVLRPRVAPPAFVREPLSPPDLPRTVSLDALARFFEHPARAFFMTRLGVSLGADLEALEEREPLLLDELARWKVATPLLERARAGEAIGPPVPRDVLAEGQLPLGVVGAFAYADMVPEVEAIAGKVRDLLGPEPPLRVPIELDVGAHDTRVLGSLRDVGSKVRVEYTYSRQSGKRQVGAWVRHVAMNAAGLHRETALLCRGQKRAWRLRPVDGAKALLDDLVALYWRGLEAPLLFFPDEAMSYAECAASDGQERALGRAVGAFRAERGSGSDAYVRRAFGDALPLEETFEPFEAPRDRGRFPSFSALAARIAAPIVAHVVEEER